MTVTLNTLHGFKRIPARTCLLGAEPSQTTTWYCTKLRAAKFATTRKWLAPAASLSAATSRWVLPAWKPYTSTRAPRAVVPTVRSVANAGFAAHENIWPLPWLGTRPNNSFKPNLLRYTKAMAERACHGFGSTTQVGLTQALGLITGILAT